MRALQAVAYLAQTDPAARTTCPLYEVTLTDSDIAGLEELFQDPMDSVMG